MHSHKLFALLNMKLDPTPCIQAILKITLEKKNEETQYYRLWVSWTGPKGVLGTERVSSLV